MNLTLTEAEERFLDATVTAGTAEHDALMQHVGARSGGTARPPDPSGSSGPQSSGSHGSTPGLADVVHVLMRLGMDRLEFEVAEMSYAAEAASDAADERERIAALEAAYRDVLANEPE